jgi:amidophosphoribosyltransferase
MPEMLLETAYDKEAEIKQDHCGLTVYANFKKNQPLFIQQIFSDEDPSLELPKPIFLDTILEIGANQDNRGQGACGVKVITQQGEVKTYRQAGRMSDRLKSGHVYQKLKENQEPLKPNDDPEVVLIQLRYGTNGGDGNQNIQPVTVETSDGEKVSVIHNGEFTNKEGMKEGLDKEFADDDSDTYVYGHLLAATPGKDWDEKIINAHSSGKVNGFYNLGIYVKGAVYLVSDSFKGRPFMYGKVKGGGWIAVSEDSALAGLEMENLQEVPRGQIIKIDENGPQVIKDFLEEDDPGRQSCIMEHTYTAKAASSIQVVDTPINQVSEDQIPLAEKEALVRFRAGVLVGRRMKEMGVELDRITGVPESGIFFGMGVTFGSGIPYEQGIVINPEHNFRVFQKDQEWDQRGLNHRKKLNFLEEYFKGARVGIADDSVMRGDASSYSVQSAREAGAEKVVFISGQPEVDGACYLGISTRSNEELIAYIYKKNREAIAKAIGADDIIYILQKELIQSIIGPRRQIIIPENPAEIFKANGLCGGCMTGVYPVSRMGEVYRSLQRELVLA